MDDACGYNKKKIKYQYICTTALIIFVIPGMAPVDNRFVTRFFDVVLVNVIVSTSVARLFSMNFPDKTKMALF